MSEDNGYEGGNEGTNEGYDQDNQYTGGQGSDSRSVNDVIQEAQKKWKLQDGDYEEEVDEETLLNYARKARGSDRRFQEAAERQRLAEEHINRAQNMARFMAAHPEQALRDMGVPEDQIDAWAESRIKRKLEDRLMSPEEKEARETKELAKRYKEHMAKEQEEKHRRSIDEMRTAQKMEIETGLMNALKSLGVVTPDPAKNYSLAMDAVKFLAHDAHKAKAEGRKPTLSYEDAVKKAVYMHRQSFKQLVSTITPQQLMSVLGPEKVKQILAENMRANSPQQQFQTKAPERQAPSRSQPEITWKNEKEWRASLRK